MMALLDRNPNTRIKAQEALNHVWIREILSEKEDAKTQNQNLINSLRN